MFNKLLTTLIIVSFACSLVTPLPQAHANSLLGLPEPGVMVALSPAYKPVIIKAITVHKDNPFMFDFIVDVGQDHVQGNALKNEGEKLIKYFLASLTIPEKDLWVNLSPYEKDRTIPKALGQTEMGRDLLAEDYILKQITASLIYPEQDLGKTFWDNVYTKARQEYGTTEVPVNTFNKVWIMADKAEIYEHNNTVFLVDSHLKVMLEEDYLALAKHNGLPGGSSDRQNCRQAGCQASEGLNAKAIIRQIILPEIEKEVNTGKNFANLRQIFNSLILASWYKKNLKEALLNQIYADKKTIKGIDLKDPQIKEQIYQRYLQAYKKGVFDFIKEDTSGPQGQIIPRKYFSGGVVGEIALTNVSRAMAATTIDGEGKDDLEDIRAGVAINGPDSAMQAAELRANVAAILQRDQQGYVHGIGALLNKLTSEEVLEDQNMIEEVKKLLDEMEVFFKSGNTQLESTYQEYEQVIAGINSQIDAIPNKKSPEVKALVSDRERQTYLQGRLERAINQGKRLLGQEGSINNARIRLGAAQLYYEMRTRGFKREEILNVLTQMTFERSAAGTSQARIVFSPWVDQDPVSLHFLPVLDDMAKSDGMRGLFFDRRPEGVIIINNPEHTAEAFDRWFNQIEMYRYTLMMMLLKNSDLLDAVRGTILRDKLPVSTSPVGYVIAGKKPPKSRVMHSKMQTLTGLFDRRAKTPEAKAQKEFYRSTYRRLLAAQQKAKTIFFQVGSTYEEQAFEALLRRTGKSVHLQRAGGLLVLVNGGGASTKKELKRSQDRGDFKYGVKNLLSEINTLPAIKDPALLAQSHTTKALIHTPADEYGGIDLSTQNVNWKVSQDGKGVEINVDQAMIARMRRVGVNSLRPVIFSITPLASIWPLIR